MLSATELAQEGEGEGATGQPGSSGTAARSKKVKKKKKLVASVIY